MERWLTTVVKMNITCAEKVVQWLGAYNWYVNGPSENSTYHYFWQLRKNSESQTALENFLQATLHIVEKASGSMSIQMNEAFHALKARFANKITSWMGSFAGRILCAVLQINWPESWVNFMFARTSTCASVELECEPVRP